MSATPSSHRSPEPGTRAEPGNIGLSEPNVSGREWEYVRECLDTGWVSSAGGFVDRFEGEFAARVGTRFAVAMASGTAALHIALLVSGVAADEEVVLPALTFIAPANTVRYVGAWPVFLDVEPNHWQLDPDRLADFLRFDCSARDGRLVNRRTGRRVRAVLPVDILGHPCDLDAIRDLAAHYDLLVIEDATESLGALYRGRPVGSESHVACFSFNGNKIITTGGGGMLVTNDEQVARRARYLATQAKDDPVEYVHRAIGYNYRLTNVQAAMGCAQIARLDEFVALKRATARRYAEGFADQPAITAYQEAAWATATFWLSTVLIDATGPHGGSRGLLRTLAAQGIQARPLWEPLHRSAAHHGADIRPCPVAEQVHREALSLPCSTGITLEQQDRVIAATRRALRTAG